MIPCKECIRQIYPDNPRVRSGRYTMCGCNYCDKPTYYREIEETQQAPNLEPLWSSRQWDKVQQLQSEVMGWRQKHAEMMMELDKMRKPKRNPKYD